MQKIIALHPKTPENRDFLSNGNSSISKKDHRSKIFLSNSKEIEKKRKKTESITFRLESEILDSLRHEARRKDISINTLISQIARQHMDWHSMAAAAGFVSVRKQLLIKLLEGQNDEQIKSVARHVALSSSKDLLLMLRRKYNIVSTLDMIETWVRIAGYSYSHNIEQD